MSLEGIKNIIEKAVAQIQWPTAFEMGRGQDVNIFSESRDEPTAWLLLPTTSGLPIGNSLRLNLTYNCEVFFFKKDEVSSHKNGTNQIVMDCHDRAVNFSIQLLSIGQDLDDVSIQFEGGALNIVPISKFSSKILTGVSLTFQITAPDDFDFCNPC